jgi:hypothetical protein
MYGFGSFRAMIVNGPCGDPLYPKRKKACLNIEKVYRRDENYVIQQSVLFTWCCFTNHFRRL